MASTSSKANNSQHIRSISFPTRSHPIIIDIKEEINKLNTQEQSTPPTIATICCRLSGLKGLYKCVDDLLSLPLTQQALSHHQNHKWIDELLDESLRLLDLCGTARDFMSRIKEQVIDLQSSIRRRRMEDLSIESSILKFISVRKKMRREAKRLIANLKQVDDRIAWSSSLDIDHHLSNVIKVVREVSAKSISIFDSLLLLLSTPVSKSKASKWSLVSKLIRKGSVTCEGQLKNMNDLQDVDSAVYNCCEEHEKMETARKKLEALHGGMEVMENGMECIFRGLIRTRTSLLNIISNL